ncbi:MAG: hypothetical protein M3P51_01325 [Chloroflexota bacterium]|nr:hypothetical protein [Chloroflexota bacterium]
MDRRASKGQRRQQGRRAPARNVMQERGAPGSTPGSTADPKRPSDSRPFEAVGSEGGWLRGRRGLVLTVLVVLLALGGPTLVGQVRSQLAGVVPPPAGLVFVRGTQLILIEPESRAERVLASMPEGGRVGNPVVSPGGGRLAFTFSQGFYGESNWGGDLYLLQLPNGHPEMVLKHAQPGDAVEAASWSPDGRSMLIAYQEALYEGESYMGTRPRLERLELATGKRRTVVENGGSSSWSPDGERIAYVRSYPEGGAEPVDRPAGRIRGTTGDRGWGVHGARERPVLPRWDPTALRRSARHNSPGGVGRGQLAGRAATGGGGGPRGAVGPMGVGGRAEAEAADPAGSGSPLRRLVSGRAPDSARQRHGAVLDGGERRQPEAG